MIGKSYYLTTLGAWRQHASRFANSHYFALASEDAVADETPILALIEADEGIHNALARDSQFTPLPHPLSPKPVPQQVQALLAEQGIRAGPEAIAAGPTTFDLAEALAEKHPLLRFRIF